MLSLFSGRKKSAQLDSRFTLLNVFLSPIETTATFRGEKKVTKNESGQCSIVLLHPKMQIKGSMKYNAQARGSWSYLITGLDCGLDCWTGLLDWIVEQKFELK